MPQHSTPILAANPNQENHIPSEQHSDIAHIAYQVAPGPKLMRAGNQMPGQGGFLYISPEPSVLCGNHGFFLQQILRECRARHYIGVIADLPPHQSGLAADMDRLLHAQGLALYLPDRYAPYAPNAKLMFSTAISGGSLRHRLMDAIRSYGRERVIPALERTAADFSIPSLSGEGTSLSNESLSLLRTRVRPDLYWSSDLCTRYFTYSEQGQPHFVLFDDGESLRAKLRLAEELGLCRCLVAWGDLQV